MAAILYAELKLPFFRNDELYFRIYHINRCRLNISFFLNSMVSDVACTVIVHFVSVMTISIFCKKPILLKLADITECHLFVTSHLLNIIISYLLRRPLDSKR